VESSMKHMNYLEHQLKAFEKKKIIPEEVAILHRKQIRRFSRYYDDIDLINRSRVKNEYI